MWKKSAVALAAFLMLATPALTACSKPAASKDAAPAAPAIASDAQAPNDSTHAGVQQDADQEPTTPKPDEKPVLPPGPGVQDPDKAAADLTLAVDQAGAADAQVAVTGGLVDAIVRVDATGVASKEAYRKKIMNVALTLSNNAMNLENLVRVRMILESDGTFGTPKNSLALSMIFEKEKVASAKWGHLADADDMLAQATTKVVEPALQ